MSRISFNSYFKNKNVEVVAGWDHPLQTFFLDILDQNENCIYSSMENSPAFYQNTNELEKFLAENDIIAPENFWDFVNRKQRNFFCKM